MGSRQNRDYEYIQVTWVILIAKFLVEIELFPPNQSGGKEMFGSQLRMLSKGNKCLLTKVSKGAKIRDRYNQVPHLTQDTNGKETNS